MYALRLAATLFAMLGSLTMIETTHGEERSEPVVIKLRVCEKWPGKEEPVVIKQPMLQALIGVPARIDVSGKEKSKVDQSEHSVGVKLNVDIPRRVDTKYELKLDMFLGAGQHSQDDPDTEIFTEHKLHIHTWAEAGKMKKISLSPAKWCEVTLEDPRKLPHPAAHAPPGNPPATDPHWRGHTESPPSSTAYPSAAPPGWKGYTESVTPSQASFPSTTPPLIARPPATTEPK